MATKAARIRSVIEDAPLLEFGTRRAQEMDAAIWGTRAAVIGGADATSNVRAGKIFGIPVSGTHAHALFKPMATIMTPLKPMHLLIRTVYSL